MSNLKKNWLEWAVFAAGLVLVVATIGFLVYQGTTMGSEPPIIEVHLGAPQPRSQNFIVPVTVVNRGDKTAEGVHIEVVLEGGGATERSEFQIPFLPRHARHEGWAAFQTDPRAARLRARVLGFEEP